MVDSLLDDLLDNLAVVGNDDLVDLERSLDGVDLVVDPFELLEGTALGFDAVIEVKLADVFEQQEKVKDVPLTRRDTTTPSRQYPTRQTRRCTCNQCCQGQ